MHCKSHDPIGCLVRTWTLLTAVFCVTFFPTLVHSESYQEASANCTLQEVAAIDPDKKTVIVYIRAFISDQFEFAKKLYTGVSYIDDPMPGFLQRSFATDQRHFSDKLGVTSRLVARFTFDQETLELKQLDAWTYCTHRINKYHVGEHTKEVLESGRNDVAPLIKSFKSAGSGLTHKFNVQSANPLVTASKLGPVVVTGSVFKVVGPINKRRIYFSVSHMPFFEVLVQNGSEVKLLKKITPEEGTTFFSLLNVTREPFRTFVLTFDDEQAEVQEVRIR